MNKSEELAQKKRNYFREKIKEAESLSPTDEKKVGDLKAQYQEWDVRK